MKFSAWFANILILSLLPITAMASAGAENQAIKQNLQQQVMLWNKGEMEKFLETTYEQSGETLYISNPIIKGYNNIKKRYFNHYPNAKKMGKVTYTLYDIKVLSPQYAMAIGQWHIKRKDHSQLGGVFSLLFKKTPTGWKALIDHSS